MVGAFVGVEILLTFKALGWIDLVSPFLILRGAPRGYARERPPRRHRGAHRLPSPARCAQLIPLISAIGVSFFLQDAVRLVESIWRNAFNLVYPTMETLNLRFSLTETIDVSVKSLVVIVASLLMLWGFTPS